MRCKLTTFWRPNHSLCSLLALVMALAPMASLQAADPSPPTEVFLTPQTVVAITARPQQVLQNPDLSLLPIEVVEAASQKYLGMNATDIVRIVAVGEPPMGLTPYYAVFVQSEKPWELSRIAPELTAHTEPGQIAGIDCLVSKDPVMPCLMVLKQSTLVIGSQGMLQKFLKKDRVRAEGVLLDLVRKNSAGHDLHLAIDLKALRPFIQLGLTQARQATPPEFQKFLEIPSLLQAAELSLNAAPSRSTRVVVHTENEVDSTKLEQLIAEGKELALAKAKKKMEAELSKLRASDDPVQQALAVYADRILGAYTNLLIPQREGNSFVLFSTDGAATQQIAPVAVIGFLVALLLPAVQAAREAARRNQSMNNIKQQLLGLLNYHDTHRNFPAHAIYSDAGQPLLSWRVQLLPYLEEQELYNQFHLDEPWDSVHNKTLIAQMPTVYASPNSAFEIQEGKSNYVVPVGKGLLFDGTLKGTVIRTIRDGTSNTIALLEVNDQQAVDWTKPNDLNYDPENPMKGLGGVRPGVFLAGFCDGHVEAISQTTDIEAIKAMFTKAGGEVLKR